MMCDTCANVVLCMWVPCTYSKCAWLLSVSVFRTCILYMQLEKTCSHTIAEAACPGTVFWPMHVAEIPKLLLIKYSTQEHGFYLPCHSAVCCQTIVACSRSRSYMFHMITSPFEYTALRPARMTDWIDSTWSTSVSRKRPPQQQKKGGGLWFDVSVCSKWPTYLVNEIRVAKLADSSHTGLSSLVSSHVMSQTDRCRSCHVLVNQLCG